MKLAVVYSRASSGITAPLVTVEAHLSPGVPRFNIVGLPETAVQESKDRVRSALLTSQFEFPTRRITVNLAPADLPKEGGRFDLPIALSILAASAQIPKNRLQEYEFTGELALSGQLRSVRGILPMVMSAFDANRCLIVPDANAFEAALVQQANVFSAGHLLDVCHYLSKGTPLKRCEAKTFSSQSFLRLDLSDVRGQPLAKRSLEIAAAGRHSVLFSGPPGTGKTMLASRLPSLLPELTDKEALEVAAIASVSLQGFDPQHWKQLAFRSPHHSSSTAALVGGGRPPRPGEVSLAHRGVLFLDELPEFNRKTLESLREPLESGSVSISRAAFQTTFPAQFQLVAAMNPCPCGYAGNSKGSCHCSPDQIQRYLGKLSGPLLDRIDMQVEVPCLPAELLVSETKPSESSVQVKARVQAALERQTLRQGKMNAHLTPQEITQFCPLRLQDAQILKQVMDKYNFSARVYHRILKVSRTIADIEGSSDILTPHLSEALSYRCLDKLKRSN